MKNILPLLTIVALVFVASCVTKNPDPNGPPYVPDPRINAASNSVKGFTDAAKPFNPYAGVTDYAVEAAFGLATAISLAFAKRKNDAAAKAKAAADAIAA